MKKSTLLILGLIICNHYIFSQNVTAQESNVSYFKQCSSFSISKPLRELAEQSLVSEETGEKEAADSKNNRLGNATLNPDALPKGEDPVRQSMQGERLMNAPLVNFDGQPGTATPPDPSGAIGPNHYVQGVNEQYRIYDRSGKALMNAVNLSSLWPGSANDGDPIVLYDKFADRWFIMQFNITGNKILIAISTTPDPTGTYYQYIFVPNSSQFPDYPKFSIWADGYYQTSNYNTDKGVVYERDKMLKGDKTAGMLVTSIPSVPQSSIFFCALSLDADGQLPPYGSPNYIMFYEDDAWGSKDQIRIYKWTADWTAKQATIVADPSLPVQAFAGIITTGRTDIAQPGTTNELDALDGILYYRAPYRIWTGYNSVVLCNVAKLSTGLAGIRWYELRQNNTTKAWSVYQQGTYGPNDNLSRFMASIAMDDNGNIGMAYAVSGASGVYPSIRYTGRLAGDALGTMTFAEQTAVAGTSSQTSTNRYGDYSHTSIDPTDGVTFWHTGEYYSGGKKTRIFSFRLLDITGINEIKNQADFNIYQFENLLTIKAKQLVSNDRIVLDLFDIAGRLISSQKVTPALNRFESSIDVTTLEKGIYLVRIGNNNFQKVVKVTVN